VRRRVLEFSALLRGDREGGDERRRPTGTEEKARGCGSGEVFCQLAVRRYGYAGASVARFLGFTISLVNRYAGSGDLLNGGDYF
jgi:hypothetical protein